MIPYVLYHSVVRLCLAPVSFPLWPAGRVTFLFSASASASPHAQLPPPHSLSVPSDPHTHPLTPLALGRYGTRNGQHTHFLVHTSRGAAGDAAPKLLCPSHRLSPARTQWLRRPLLRIGLIPHGCDARVSRAHTRVQRVCGCEPLGL